MVEQVVLTNPECWAIMNALKKTARDLVANTTIQELPQRLQRFVNFTSNYEGDPVVGLDLLITAGNLNQGIFDRSEIR